MEHDSDKLEQLVFGRASTSGSTKRKKLATDGIVPFKPQPLFVLDAKPSILKGIEDDGKLTLVKPEEAFLTEEASEPKRKAAWSDDDDDIPDNTRERSISESGKQWNTYKKNLEEKFKKQLSRPKWATETEFRKCNDLSDDELEIEREADSLLEKPKALPSDELKFKFVDNVTKYNDIQDMAVAVDFHPSEQVIMGATRNSCSLMDLKSPKYESMRTIKTQYRIFDSQFTKDGLELLISLDTFTGIYAYYDIIADKLVPVIHRDANKCLRMGKLAQSNDGKWIAGAANNYCSLLSRETKELVHRFIIGGKVQAVAFSPDSRKMFVGGDNGRCFIYDIRSMNKCSHRFMDEGFSNVTAMDISPNSNHVAVGSVSGIVNVYDYLDVSCNQTPKPVKAISNLVTAIQDMKFSSYGEMLSISTNLLGDKGIRNVHIPSYKVFKNFPGNMNLGEINCKRFSPHDKYMAIGTSRGITMLEMQHYERY